MMILMMMVKGVVMIVMSIMMMMEVMMLSLETGIHKSRRREGIHRQIRLFYRYMSV